MRLAPLARTALWVLGAAAVLRMHREARRVRAGELPPIGPQGVSAGEARDDVVHRTVREWQPGPPRTRLGRAAAGLWAAPLTAVGVAAALAGGRRPQWDPDVGALVVTSVRGPFRWFLAQQGAAAATLGHVVVTREPAPSPALLRHEAQHSRQQERLGLLFALAYPLAGARWGYRDNPFEVAARDAARDHGPRNAR